MKPVKESSIWVVPFVSVLRGVRCWALGLFIMIAMLCNNGLSATVSVNVTNIITSYDSNPVGINLDFLADARPDYDPINDALIELGVGSLRFPMGDLADNYVFSADGTNDYSYCAVRGTNFIPFCNSSYVNQADGTFINAMTTFEFVSLVQETGAKPFFVVGIDALLQDRTNGVSTRTNEPLVNVNWSNYTAVAKSDVYNAVSNWVRYVKDLGVEGAHWEIGNECYLDREFIGSWVPEKYAVVVNELSAIIKSVDSSAQVGCNGGLYYDKEWWNKVFPLVENTIDFAVVHQYFKASVGTNYTAYMGMAATNSLTGEYDDAFKAWTNKVSAANRARIKFCVTEFSSFNLKASTNNLGKALMNFNLIGDFLEKKSVSNLQFWITRYISRQSNYIATNLYVGGNLIVTNVYNDMCALDDDNNLLPMGQSIALWTQFFHPCILATTSDQKSIVAYATTRASDRALNVLILNRSTSGQSVTVNLNGFQGNSLNTRWQFGGTNDPSILNPTLTTLAPVSLSNNTFTIWAMPCSVTVVEFAPKFEVGVKYNIISRNSGSLLELSDPYTDGGNAEIWEDRGYWGRQQWTFVEKDTAGFYEIVNQAQLNGTNCDKRIEYANPASNPANTNVVGWADRDSSWLRQKWCVNLDHGWSVLVNKTDTNKVLEVANGGITNGSNVQVGNYQPGWGKQHWLIVPAQ